MAAGSAAVGGDPQPTLEPEEPPLGDEFPRNPLHIKVTAERAVNVDDVGNRRGPRVEARFAGTTPPRMQAKPA